MFGLIKRFTAPLILIGAFVLVAANADAGTITLSDSVEFKLDGDRLIGELIVANSGDETARSVMPVVKIGGWTWSGHRQNIEAGAKESWTISEHLTVQAFECSLDEKCKMLPAVGIVPLLLTKTYKDNNGYSFSTVDVHLLEHNLSQQAQKDFSGTPVFDGRLEASGSGDIYELSLTLRNLSASEHTAHVSFLASRELIVTEPTFKKRISPAEVVKREIEVENFRGLPGSSYRTLALVEWSQNGERNAIVLPTSLKLLPASGVAGFNWSAVVIVSLVLVTLSVVVVRRWRGRDGQG